MSRTTSQAEKRPDQTIGIDEDLEEFFRGASALAATKKLKSANPFVLDLIIALWKHPEGASRRFVIDAIEHRRYEIGLSIPKEFERAVQSAFNHHNCQSVVFQRRQALSDDDLFYPVGRKGSGTWGLYHDRALAWLRSKGLNIPT